MPSYKLKNTGHNITLSAKEYVAEGGEGTIFAKGGIAYKVCFPGKMMPDGKIKELSILDQPYILRPLDIMLDNKGNSVGYTMNFIPQSDCYCLASTFTNTFKSREGLTDDKVIKLVEFMKSGVEFIHGKNILIVDLNEFNFLVNKKFDTVYFIDTNSYQTRSYPATAIMESIRDRHNHKQSYRSSAKFTELTDWFSYAIVSFEMLIGIHPFRGGNHPSFNNTNLDERMDARMIANVSVLNPATKFPKNAVRPFTVIPSAYLDWYKKIFEQGERLPPPNSFVNQIVILTPRLSSILSNVLNIKEVFRCAEKVDHVVFSHNRRLVVTSGFVYVDDKVVKKTVPTKNVFFKDAEFYSANVENGNVALYNINRQMTVNLKNNLDAKQICVIQNRVYCQVADKIMELEFVKDSLHAHVVASTMEHATTFGDGFISQNVAGSNYFIIFPSSRQSIQVRIKELDKVKIISGKMVGNICVLFTKNNKNVISKHKIVFDNDGYYQLASEHGVDIYDNQLILLDNGLVIETDKDGNLVATKKTASKYISDNFLSNEPYILTNDGTTVMLAKDKILYEISMKGP